MTAPRPAPSRRRPRGRASPPAAGTTWWAKSVVTPVSHSSASNTQSRCISRFAIGGGSSHPSTATAGRVRRGDQRHRRGQRQLPDLAFLEDPQHRLGHRRRRGGQLVEVDQRAVRGRGAAGERRRAVPDLAVHLDRQAQEIAGLPDRPHHGLGVETPRPGVGADLRGLADPRVTPHQGRDVARGHRRRTPASSGWTGKWLPCLRCVRRVSFVTQSMAPNRPHQPRPPRQKNGRRPSRTSITLITQIALPSRFTGN